MTLRYTPFQVTYQFKDSMGVKIGSGQSKFGMIDNAFRIRHEIMRGTEPQANVIYSIPATMVKGRIRASFHRLLPHLLKDKSEHYEGLIFGTEGKEGFAKFSDLLPERPEYVAIELQTNTAIDRFRRAAKQETLRVTEYMGLHKTVNLNGEIEGFLPVNEQAGDEINKIPELLAYLLIALKNTTFFGKEKSTGWGKGMISLQRLVVGNKVWTGDVEIVNDIVKHSNGKEE